MGRQKGIQSFKHNVIVEALTSGETFEEVAASKSIHQALLQSGRMHSSVEKKAHKAHEEKDETIETLA